MTFENYSGIKMSAQTYSQQLKIWQEILVDLQQENAMLKIRLSELVDNSVMSDFLQKAEILYAELITNDESLTVLLDAVNHLSASVNGAGGNFPSKVGEKIKQLSSDVRTFQRRFGYFSNRFQQEFYPA